ncbi:hypothetical protein JYK00_01130 [Thermosipho ferrireducens]|uniref:CRISPR type III-B/RAMP module-associated protein Cmr5 n=1 Tax=Thermosipho ferrireducens TaxID=2571116 RepID=A0ABX7S6G0_9BACT|nr:hypothetical protein [Thermosipho ferrireducens]QTA38173.1 hypothetical protein JYK00_01130 [Thermosipho ferrireducens]
MENLEYKINEVAWKIVEKIKEDKKKYKNEIDKALGVLTNNGVYAYWVYCKSKGIEKVFIEEVRELMKYTSVNLKDENGKNKNEEYEKYFRELSKSLKDLLFFKEILEKTLILVRYHAKALEDGDE